MLKCSPVLAAIDYAAWASVLISVIAFGAVLWEYRRQKQQARLQLAQQMMQRLDDDPMLRFATTALDWGAGLVIVPDSWRGPIDKPVVLFNLDAIWDGLRPKLTPSTESDPLRLLYRHAFVHLFNHLERVGTLVEIGAIDVRDLGPIAWIAHQLLSWSYARGKPPEHFFLPAMRGWYDNGAPEKLVRRLAARFPAAERRAADTPPLAEYPATAPPKQAGDVPGKPDSRESQG
jgi:hypothetical protein